MLIQLGTDLVAHKELWRPGLVGALREALGFLEVGQFQAVEALFLVKREDVAIEEAGGADKILNLKRCILISNFVYYILFLSKLPNYLLSCQKGPKKTPKSFKFHN